MEESIRAFLSLNVSRDQPPTFMYVEASCCAVALHGFHCARVALLARFVAVLMNSFERAQRGSFRGPGQPTMAGAVFTDSCRARCATAPFCSNQGQVPNPNGGDWDDALMQEIDQLLKV